MDAEVSPADGAVQNIHAEDIGTIQWQREWQNFAGD